MTWAKASGVNTLTKLDGRGSGAGVPSVVVPSSPESGTCQLSEEVADQVPQLTMHDNCWPNALICGTIVRFAVVVVRWTPPLVTWLTGFSKVVAVLEKCHVTFWAENTSLRAHLTGDAEIRSNRVWPFRFYPVGWSHLL